MFQVKQLWCRNFTLSFHVQTFFTNRHFSNSDIKFKIGITFTSESSVEALSRKVNSKIDAEVAIYFFLTHSLERISPNPQKSFVIPILDLRNFNREQVPSQCKSVKYEKLLSKTHRKLQSSKCTRNNIYLSPYTRTKHPVFTTPSMWHTALQFEPFIGSLHSICSLLHCMSCDHTSAKAPLLCIQHTGGLCGLRQRPAGGTRTTTAMKIVHNTVRQPMSMAGCQ